MGFWDARRIAFDCTVEGCPVEAAVTVVDPDGNEHGKYCGPHGDAVVNAENAPLFAALRESEAARLAAEAGEDVTV